jgi:hypothetical protein
MPKILIACFAVLLIAVPAAQASTSQESIFQDDTVLLNGNPGASLDQLQGLGVSTVHTLAFWDKIAPSPTSAKRPSADLSNPNTYSNAAWAPYDALVRGAAARGIQVLMTPTGFTPRWAACKKHAAKYRNCQPNAKLYGQFVSALARRYSGSFKDASGQTLPRVKRWSFWNEPNQIGWIYPQRKSGAVVSAKYYRDLVYSGLAALKKTGHRSDQVLLGETAPSARGNSTDPTNFLRALFCIDGRGHRLHGKVAKAEGCTHFKRISGISGFAHHPYNTSAVGPALRKPRGKGDITLAVLGRLTRVLQLGAKGHAIKRGLPIYFTEYGIQTDPPNSLYGVSLAQQAAFLNQADFTAYKNRAVRSVSQYELVDDPAISGVFTTGLVLKNGTQKPSYDAYRLPIWVTKKGSRASIWLWVRPAGGKPQQVQIQHDTGSGFQTVATKTTNSRGFATVSQSGGGRWRFSWTSAGGVTYFSRAA